jgi:hypothetical protein
VNPVISDPAEQRDLNLDLPLLLVDVFDRAREVRKWAFRNLDRLSDVERNPLFFFEIRLLHGGLDAEDLVDLVVPQRLRHRAAADEFDHALDVIDLVQRPLVEDHLDQNVTGVKPPALGDLLATLDLDDIVGRNDDFLDLLLLDGASVLLLDLTNDQSPDFVLVPRVRLYRVPPGILLGSLIVHSSSSTQGADYYANQLAEYQVHQTDDGRHDQHEDDDHARGVAQLLQIRPSDLLHLRRDSAEEFAKLTQSLEHWGDRYLVSLCFVCLPQRTQYFLYSTRSGCFCRFLVVL